MWTTNQHNDGSLWVTGEGLFDAKSLVTLTNVLIGLSPTDALVLDLRAVHWGEKWPTGWQSLIQYVATLRMAVVLGAHASEWGWYLAWASPTWVALDVPPVPRSPLGKWLLQRGGSRGRGGFVGTDRVTRAIRRQQLQSLQPKPLDWGIRRQLTQAWQHHLSPPNTLAHALATLNHLPSALPTLAPPPRPIHLQTNDVAWILQLVMRGISVHLHPRHAETLAAKLQPHYRRFPKWIGQRVSFAPPIADEPSVPTTALLIALDREHNGYWRYQGKTEALSRRGDLWDCPHCPALLETVIQIVGGEWVPDSAPIVDVLGGVYVNTAADLLASGVSVSLIERAGRSLGLTTGPLTYLDDWGADRAEARIEQMTARGMMDEPHRLLSLLRADERYGRRVQRGIYRYGAGRRWGVDPQTYRLLQRWPQPTQPPLSEVRARFAHAFQQARLRLQPRYGASVIERVWGRGLPDQNALF